ncbi:hypothetical protein DPV78_011124 [Talaromyces pinophilus]|nr:hypothetical protein DPV78_011124 [Talaromyces pinophilus]
MCYYGFDGTVEIPAQYLNETVSGVQIHPLFYNISPKHARNNTYNFELTSASNVVFQVSENIFFNALHIFTNPTEKDIPSANATDVFDFGPGVHSAPGGVLNVTEGQTIYLAGGAVLTSPIHVLNTTNVAIRGRGSRSGAFLAGQSDDVTFRNIHAFSASSWGDGIDLYSTKNVIVQNVFMRTSDDCIAIYNHRNHWYRKFHKYHDDPKSLSDLTICNIDIIYHREPQMNYQDCTAIDPGDGNTVRDILIEDIRVENSRLGQLVNMRVMCNNKYNTAPGHLILNMPIRDMIYNGDHSNPSLILG